MHRQHALAVDLPAVHSPENRSPAPPSPPAEAPVAVTGPEVPTECGIYLLPAPRPGYVRCCIVGHAAELLFDALHAERLVNDEQRCRWTSILKAGTAQRAPAAPLRRGHLALAE